MKSYKYKLEGLDCANCAKKIEEKIAATDSYENVVVNFSTSKLSFQTTKENKEKIEEEIKQIVHSLEPDVIVTELGTGARLGEGQGTDTANGTGTANEMETVDGTETADGIGKNAKKAKKQKQQKSERTNNDILRLIIGICIYFTATLPVVTHFLTDTFGSSMAKDIEIAITIIALAILLMRIVPKAFKQLIKNHVLDENMLITISVIGACLVGKSTEGVMVITLYEIGKILEAKAVNKTRKSISDLMDIKPEYANLKIEDTTKQVNPEEVNIGDIIVIKTGEKIPLDGKIIKGEAEINNQALTGESRLIQVKKNDQVLSGGINVNGLIEVQVEKTYENSTVNQILNLVENATDKKAKTENFVARAAKIYTPVVIGLAILVAIFMPLIFKNVTYSESIYKALIFLVISCPCSIAISVPLSYFTGIGKASKRGILIKGSDYLDGIRDIKQIIFDKTGTITTGNFKIASTQSLKNEYSEKDVLRYFAIGESFSNHPIAKSIVEEVKKTENIDIKNVQNLKEIPGKGITYEIDGKSIRIGNIELAGDSKVTTDNKITENSKAIGDRQLIKDNSQGENDQGTVLYLNIDGELVGKVILEDEIKPNVKQTMEKLRKLGIKTRMFTGDKKEIANKIAKEVGIQEVKAEMLPQNKYEELEKILKQTNKEKVAYVGDGINDSPVLARADIGISMGGIGQSSAIEASDMVIMTDELCKILEAIEISKKTNLIIKQNLIFSIGVKLLTLLLSLFGIADMWQAVFADVGTTLITVLNTMRILK